jgi:type IV pilus assembly protein PilY1
MKILNRINQFKLIYFALIVLLTHCTLLVSTQVYAAPPPLVPPQVQPLKRLPMIMLNLSRDHQLSYRAYNEYSDINNDGVPDTTYLHSFDYYGYFDSYKCYKYDSGLGLFSPKATTVDKYCTSAWSGNFLNWASMTRMDVVRKILYGGTRYSDTATNTVLERHYLPTDAHSFAKYYNGADIAKLTPFTVAEISMCNTTMPSATNGNGEWSHTTTQPPLMRIVQGNYALWNANERYQCHFQEEGTKYNGTTAGSVGTNGNDPLITGLSASSKNPYGAASGLKDGGAGPDYIVRVQSCVTGLIGNERCKKYPDGNYKPIGLLHEYGEDNLAEFGLMTGSWSRNISGGVLRKNMSSFQDEVNYTTNGTFTSVKGIAANINAMRVYGYYYGDGTYLDAAVEDCNFQTIGLTEGKCTSWGTPMGSIYLESLRYFAGKTAAITGALSKDAALGLTSPSWVDPFLRSNTAARTSIENQFGSAICRPINVLNFNASVSSYDSDLAKITDLGAASGSAKALTNTIGDKEGINGTKRFVGRYGADPNNGLCTAKTVASLGEANGLCPDAATYYGNYLMAGAAYYAHTNPIRSDFNPISSKTPQAFKVNTFGVALSIGAPRIEVPVGGKTIVIQPSYRLDKNGDGKTVGGGSLVDFRIISQAADKTSGKFFVSWEDSEQGGDYDMDVIGTLEYKIEAGQVKVTTYVIRQSTANPQGFGYIISGTTQDGPHFHSGIKDFNFNDPTNITVTPTPNVNVNASGGCANCNETQIATTAAYTPSASSVSLGLPLNDPLWYAAKWGGFDVTKTSTGFPDSANITSWDIKKMSGAAGGDGIPDNYYYAINPAELERSLRAAFDAATQPGYVAPAVSTKVLSKDSIAVSTEYSERDQTGQVDFYRLDSTGKTLSTFLDGITDPKAGAPYRSIITRSDGAGRIFKWANLGSAGPNGTIYQGLLNIGPSGVSDSLGSKRVDYVRGNASAAADASLFRARKSALGTIVNSNAWVTTRPSARFFPSRPGYSDFRNTYKNRLSTTWVGANDGMLHGFDLATGNPLLSYIPEAALTRLASTTYPGVKLQPLVDGSPFTADVNIGGATASTADWRTYLFGVQGRGGQSIFALDITNPSAFVNETTAATASAWEFSDKSDAGAKELGYILNRPRLNGLDDQPMNVLTLKDGGTYVVINNGYGNDDANGGLDTAVGTGKAALYILPVAGPGAAAWQEGVNYWKLEAGIAGGNGLSDITAVATTSDGKIDYIYAGDLNGSVWRFDLSSPTWKSAVGANKSALSTEIFRAASPTGQPQPITSGLSWQFHPLGGIMLGVGTGKALQSGDFPTTKVNTIYGIWDKLAANPAIVPRNKLQQILLDTTSNQFTSATPIDWTTQLGWYWDLPAGSEMVLDYVIGLGRATFRIQTLFPSAQDPSNPDCNSSVAGRDILIDSFSGTASSEYQFINTDSNFIITDGRPLATVIAPGQRDQVLCVGVNCNTATNAASRTVEPSNKNGRLFWREVPGIKSCESSECR